MGYIMPLLCLGMIPIHFHVPCRVSGQLGLAGLLPLGFSFVFAFMDKKIKGRMFPVVYTFIAFIANSMFVH